jgi:hypothetical protein
MKLMRQQSGITLVELMVSIAICTGMIVPVTLLLTNVNYAAKLGTDQVNNQRDISFAMNRMGVIVRSGSTINVTNNGASIDVLNVSGGVTQWTKTFLVQNGALKMTQTGLADEILLASGVVSATFSYVHAGGQDSHLGVQVALTVGSGQQQVTANTSLSVHNQD